MVSLIKKPQRLRRMLILSILAVHVSIFLVTLLINFVVLFRISKVQTLEEGQNNLAYMEYRMDNLISNLTDIRNYLLVDYNVMEYLRTERSTELSDITRQINTTQQISQLIQSYTYLDSITLFQWNGDFLSIGKKRVSRGDADSEILPIQNSEIFQNMTSSSSLTWGGSYKQHEMFLNQHNAPHDSKSVVSLLMPLVNIWHPEKTAIVSINIPLSYFDFLYSKNEEKGANIFLFDESGNFLFSSSEKVSLQESDRPIRYGEKLRSELQYTGHFRLQENTLLYNIVYRKDNLTGWYLAEEIPYPVILSDMLYLQFTTGLTFLISIMIILVISYFVTRKLLFSLETISGQIVAIGDGDLKSRLPSTDYDELNQLTFKFNEMMGRIEHLVEDKIKNEQDKRELEIEVLQSQINPHFLYNSLTTIRWMASLARASNVCQALLALNNVLRPVFSHAGILWRLKEEQVFVENFVDIMNFRFGENIKCVYHIPEDAGSVNILRFLLQPIVENCISHGLRGKPNSLITIRAQKEGSMLSITVEDNGQGIEPDKLEKLKLRIAAPYQPQKTEANSSHGFGLYNVNRRIKLQYGEQYGLNLSSEISRGTLVQVYIPADI